MSVCLYACLCIYHTDPSKCLFRHLSTCVVCLSICLYVRLENILCMYTNMCVLDNKAPVLNDFPYKFYQKLWSTLLPIEKQMTLKDQNPFHNINTAMVLLLLQSDKDPTLCTSYFLYH